MSYAFPGALPMPVLKNSEAQEQKGDAEESHLLDAVAPMPPLRAGILLPLHSRNIESHKVLPFLNSPV